MGESMKNEPLGDDGKIPCARGCGERLNGPHEQDEHNKKHLSLRGASDVFGMIAQSTADDSDL